MSELGMEAFNWFHRMGQRVAERVDAGEDVEVCVVMVSGDDLAIIMAMDLNEPPEHMRERKVRILASALVSEALNNPTHEHTDTVPQ